MVKNQTKPKQHPEAKLYLFENYSLSSSTLSAKNSKRYSKQYKKQVYLFKWGYVFNDNENETKNKK